MSNQRPSSLFFMPPRQLQLKIYYKRAFQEEVPTCEVLSAQSVPRLEAGTSRFWSQDDATTQKGLTQNCGRITSTSAFLPLLKTGDSRRVTPAAVLWPVIRPTFYTTGDTIVYDKIYFYTNSEISAWIFFWSVECPVSSQIRTRNLWLPKEDDTTQKGLTRM